MRYRHIATRLLVMTMLTMGTGISPIFAAPDYPAAARGTVVDNYHGSEVADPYRWLEDATSAATRDFVKAQNALATPWLEALPQRSAIRDRLTRNWNYERVGLPRQKGGRYFFIRNDGMQNQSVLYVAAGLRETPRVLFDPNTASGDATAGALRALSRWSDRRLLALRWRYGLGDLEVSASGRRT